MKIRFGQFGLSRRDDVIQPSVDATKERLRWLRITNAANPERVEAMRANGDATPLGLKMFWDGDPGWLVPRNPGLND